MSIENITTNLNNSGLNICAGPSLCLFSKDINKHIIPKFGGAFYTLNNNYKEIFVYIKKIIYNAPATIVFWNDNTKTISKCDTNDNYNPETGLLLCVMKKLYGNDTIHSLLKDWSSPRNFDVVTLADVRRKHR